MPVNKKLFVLAAGASLLSAAVFTSVYVNNSRSSMNDLLSANVEVLAQNESLDTNYKRDDTQKCVITVGANSSVEIFGLGIFKADGNGEISFSGKVICSAGGSQTCKPVECVDLYRVIFHGE